ncbi:MAG: NapH/MauN family ferredoxin-type protein [Sulfurimonas sp.]|nr:NapH/MauN family ferredoxin-type protein [Sulfurimonas sp.]
MDKYNSRSTIKNTSFMSTFLIKNGNGKNRLSLRAKRFVVIIAVHLLFFLSFAIDIQILEGTLSGSRFLGFHLIDLFSIIQVYLATYHLSINMIIGAVTILSVYLLVGGRTYCAWICPYGLLSEIAEKMNNTLVAKGVIKNREFNHKVRYVFWAIFMILAFSSGYLVFETFNVVGILSRFIAYGWSIALVWVVAILAVETFYSRRAWCRYICPIGTTYGILGPISATRVEWNDNCDHCMVCHDVCFENQVLDLTKAKHAKSNKENGISHQYVTGADCTLCGRCIDVCHQDALSINFRLKELI